MKIKIIFLFFVFIIPLVYADLILPSNYEINVKTHQLNNQNFLIKNTYNFKLHDIKIDGLPGFNFPYFDLDTGEERIVNYTILRNDTGTFNYNAEVRYKYEVDLPIEEDLHHVSITNDGFKPSFLTMRVGDKIVWTNNDTITRTVTSTTFDKSLIPNETYEMQFDNLGTINYQDLTLFHGGTISVVNDTQGELVQNPDLNKNWAVKLTAYLQNTTLEAINNIGNYTITMNDTAQGIMEIKNKGTFMAESIILTSNPNWVKFQKNNFNLDPGKNIFVVYDINPLIFETSETNKTHNISIDIKSSNTNVITKKLAIYVPYSMVLENLGSQEGFLAFYMKYCQANPNTLICNNTLSQTQEPKIIYRDSEIPINITQKEAYAMLRRQGEVFSSVETTNNEIKKVLNTISNELPKIKTELEEIKTKQIELEKKKGSDNLAFWLILLFSGTVCSIIIIGYTVTKYRTKKMRGF